MKNNKFCFAIIIMFILSFLVSGCANPASNRAAHEVQNPSPAETAGLLKIHFIDVGQGDAILVQTPAGQNMLVDAGENSQGDVMINYLLSQGVNRLDIVVGTHPHSDHIGGLDTVINRLPVKSIYMPKATNNTESFRDVLTAVKNQGLKISTAKAGVDLPLDGLNCRFIAPVKDTYEKLNNYSAVIRLDYGSQSFLLTGDAEAESEAQMLSSGIALKSTVLKVGHHGSSTSTSTKFLKAVAPQYAIIMLGRDNPYNHPHAQTLTKLNKAGVKIYRTDQNGTIVFTTDGKDMQISQGR